jgi:hypothetical protein
VVVVRAPDLAILKGWFSGCSPYMENLWSMEVAQSQGMRYYDLAALMSINCCLHLKSEYSKII